MMISSRDLRIRRVAFRLRWSLGSLRCCLPSSPCLSSSGCLCLLTQPLPHLLSCAVLSPALVWTVLCWRLTTHSWLRSRSRYSIHALCHSDPARRSRRLHTARNSACDPFAFVSGDGACLQLYRLGCSLTLVEFDVAE